VNQRPNAPRSARSFANGLYNAGLVVQMHERYQRRQGVNCRLQFAKPAPGWIYRVE
jgi:hypothetical protein